MNNSEEIVIINGMDMPVDESLEEMMGAGVFYGRKKTKTHPRMKDFIFGNRGGIEIIDLYKTKDTLEEAVSFLKTKVRAGGVVLFVGTQPMASGIGELAKSLGFPYVTNRWVGGTLTNFKTLSERIAYFRKLKSDLASGALVEKYTKKERVNFEKELQRLEDLFGGIREIDRVPDVLVVIDPVLHETAVREGRRAGIPIIALASTDADPDLVDYAVIGNNKSTKSVAWFLEKIADAIREAKKEVQAALVKNTEGTSSEEKK